MAGLQTWVLSLRVVLNNIVLLAQGWAAPSRGSRDPPEHFFQHTIVARPAVDGGGKQREGGRCAVFLHVRTWCPCSRHRRQVQDVQNSRRVSPFSPFPRFPLRLLECAYAQVLGQAGLRRCDERGAGAVMARCSVASVPWEGDGGVGAEGTKSGYRPQPQR